MPNETPSPSLPSAPRLFVPGRNCCTVARARRVALLIDGEAYFRAFTEAAEHAEHSIAILAWDFNSSTRLHFDPEGRGPPSALGDFLNWLVRRRRGLHIHILNWDYPLVFGTDRELRPIYGFGWHAHRRVHLAYDNTHPVGGSHHQKIVVIDNALGFIGGFDLTVRRWDDCAHRPGEPRRACAGRPYPPFHDVMMMVDDDAARAMADIVRSRWRSATGQALPPPRPGASPWPSRTRPDLQDVDIALARTLPAVNGQPAATEIEALYLDMIAAARERIYIENQYFTAWRLGDALAARLAEADGPEIVVVVRRFSHGWLEEHTMHVLRSRLVQRLREADAHGRFHILYPHVEGLEEKTCIDLHSKLMIVDDELLRIGSANLSNRSMGMDSECDAVIEAHGAPRVAQGIRAFRNRLLGEHLDVPEEAVEDAVRQHGSLRGAIDALAGRPRTLRALEKLPEWPAAVVEFARVGDPAEPVSLERLVEEFSPESLPASESETEDERPPSASRSARARALLRRHALRIGGLILTLAALAALWRYTPLADWVNAERMSGWAHEFADRPWAPLLILLAYTPACIVLFPRPLITLAAVVAFGPWLGFVYALAGILLAALLTYLVGLYLPQHTIRRLAGTQLRPIAETLRRRSLLAVTALRLVPLAPFAVEGLIAPGFGIGLAPFLTGTLIGILPGTLATTVFGNEFQAALVDPSRVSYGTLAALVLVLLLLSLTVRRWLVTQHRLSDHHAQPNPRAR